MAVSTQGAIVEQGENNIALDHIAFNAKFQLAQAVAVFEQLGFQLTAPSRHTLGSVNQLIVFPESYLEIIGLPDGASRPDLEAGWLGLDGLVLNSQEIAATATALEQAGFALQPVQHFSRDIQFDSKPVSAKFAAVRLQPGQFTSSRVYACQHLTAQYIWHPPWFVHANTVERLSGLLFVADDILQLQKQYARLGQFNNFALHFTDRAAWQLDSWYPPLHAERAAALIFSAKDLDRVQQLAERAGLAWRRLAQSLQVKLPDFDCVLQFEAASVVA